jgi:S1-C subfamily serine protease
VLSVLILTTLAVFYTEDEAPADTPAVETISEYVPDGLSKERIQAAYETVSPAVCVVAYTLEVTNASGEASRRNRSALGLVVAEDGLVMTHGHLLLENRKPINIKVTVGEGDAQKEYEGALLAKPDDINVCFIRIKDLGDVKLPHATFDSDDTLELGDPIMSIGILSQALDYARSVQTRRIGAILQEPRTAYAVDQTFAFGFVGGPVFSADGRAIGVIGFDLSAEEGGEIYTRSGYPLVFQASLFQAHIDDPPGEEEEKTPEDDAFMGVFTQPLTDDLARYWGVEETGGIVVSTVLPGSPAAQAGLRMGDLLKDFNGKSITAKLDQEVAKFTRMIRESPLDTPLPFTMIRDGETTEATITLTVRPKSRRDANEYEDERLGLTVREVTLDVRITLNLAEDVEGVIVRRVQSGSAANQAQLRPGMVILRVGGEAIANLEEFEAISHRLAEEKPAEITLFCRVGATTAFFRMQPRWDD